MELADKVRLRRMELGWSQEELASRMGYKSRSSINKIENGRPVTQKIIYRLSEVLDVPINYLMGWEEAIQKNPVEMAEIHVEMLQDEDLMEMLPDFWKLDKREKQIVKNLVHDMAEEKTEA